MRCPACGLSNPDKTKQCTGCGKSLVRRPRRRASAADADAPVSPEVERCNSAALAAYRVCLWALVPGVGLMLGPASLILGTTAMLRGLRKPGFTGMGLVTATLFLGAAITATQWAGATLIALGWRAAP